MSFVRRKTVCALLIAAAIGIGLQLAWSMALPVPGSHRTPSDRWAYELQRARAHIRMKDTLYASTPTRADAGSMCPALVGGGRGLPVALDRRDAPRLKSASESAMDLFLNRISGPIVQAKCVNCHVQGGVSGHTRLVFQPSSTPGHAALNLAMFENFLATVDDGANRILNKIQGVGQRRRVVQPDQSLDTGFRGSCQCEAGTVGR